MIIYIYVYVCVYMCFPLNNLDIADRLITLQNKASLKNNDIL